MSVHEATHTGVPTLPLARGRGLFRDLDRPADVVAHLGPNWFASVMGTGIVATAAATLPVQWPGLRPFATAIWVLSALWLIIVTGAEIVHWTRHRDAALGHARDPVMVQFYGAPPMALPTVGAGGLLLGPGLIGAHAAITIDAVLWALGTITGLVASLAVPYLMVTRWQAAPDAAFGGWLMPVVPPMVSAATGALLVPHLTAGQLRLTMLLACYAMFGLSLIASLMVITQLSRRLVRYGAGPAAMVPTLWIVLGPLGQSITAANLLGEVAHLALPPPFSTAFAAFGVVYGVPVWGFAALWAGLATALTLRAGRHQLPFGLTWWSFTFPVGTCVTGTSGLARHNGADGLPLGRGGPVSRPRRRLGHGERPHRPRRLAWPPLPAPAPGKDSSRVCATALKFVLKVHAAALTAPV